MKKSFLLVATALCLTGCNNHDSESNIQNTQPETPRIELTCTPEIPDTQQVYISIDTATKSVVDNGVKAENVLIEKGRIVYEAPGATKKYIVRIDRTSGKMEVKGSNETDPQLNYACELVKQRF